MTFWRQSGRMLEGHGLKTAAIDSMYWPSEAPLRRALCSLFSFLVRNMTVLALLQEVASPLIELQSFQKCAGCTFGCTVGCTFGCTYRRMASLKHINCMSKSWKAIFDQRSQLRQTGNSACRRTALENGRSSFFDGALLCSQAWRQYRQAISVMKLLGETEYWYTYQG